MSEQTREAIIAANTMMYALAEAEEKGLVLPPGVKAAQRFLVDKLMAEANARPALRGVPGE